MKIILKCICGTDLTCSTDPYYTKEGDVLITINRCEQCDASIYHDGLARGSQLKVPLQQDGESIGDYRCRLRKAEKGDANDEEAKT